MARLMTERLLKIEEFAILSSAAKIWIKNFSKPYMYPIHNGYYSPGSAIRSRIVGPQYLMGNFTVLL